MAKPNYRMYCAVFGCLNSTLTHPEITFFKLPGNTERRLEWLQLICRNDLDNKPNFGTYRLCEKHFNVEDIRQSVNRKLLKKNAYPLLMLPNLPSTVPGGRRKEDKETQTALSIGVENCTHAENAANESYAQTSTSLSCNTPKMKKLPICRVCLNTNVRHVVKDPQLQEIYERLTAIPTTDMRPLTLCSICHAQLNASRRLMLKCQKTEELLTQMLNQLQANEDEEQTAILIDQSAVNQLTVSSIELDELEVMDGTVETDDIDDKDPLLLNEVNIKLEEQNMRDILETAGGIDAESDMEHNLSDAGDQILETVTEQEELKVERTEQNELQQAAPSVKKHQLKSNDMKYVNTNTDDDQVKASKSTCDEVIDHLVFDDEKNEEKMETGVNNSVAVSSKAIKERFRNSYTRRINRSNSKKNSIEHEKVVQTSDLSYNNDGSSRFHDGSNKKPIVLNGEEKHTCDVCKNYFKDRINLIKHQRIHTGGGPYVCKVCQKCFKSSTELKTHELIHTDEKPHRCYVCNKTFRHYSCLSRHARIHAGVKRHICNVCGKRFHQKGSLTIHIRTHTGEKPYVCDNCGKSFISKHDLKRHTRVHTGVKPYVCGVCKKCFSSNPRLKIHARTHTGEKL